MPTPPACPVCGALVPAAGLGAVLHVEWHATTSTLADWNVHEARSHMRAAVDAYQGAIGDTLKLPPIGDTVRRRPPVPDVRELKGAELLRALADEVDRGTFDDFDDWPPCEAGVVAGRECRWPAETPCLGYGSPGCGMKAQES